MFASRGDELFARTTSPCAKRGPVTPFDAMQSLALCFLASLLIAACDGTDHEKPAVCGGANEATILASGQVDPNAIAVDGSNVYWTNGGSFLPDGGIDRIGAVMKVPISGGSPVLLASASDPTGIAVNGSNVYWTNSVLFDSELQSTSLAGGPVTVLTTTELPEGIAVDGTSVYWAESFAIKKVPIEGGASSVLTSAQSARALALFASNVYFSDAGTIKKVSVDGGVVTVLASGLQAAVRSIAADATGIYWGVSMGSLPSDPGTILGSIMKVPLTGGSPIILASGVSPASVAVDGKYVYWLNSTGTLMRVSVNGGVPVMLSHAGVGLNALAITGTDVYWTEANCGTIMRLTPK